MFLSPSTIHFTHCEVGQGLPDITKDTDMEELCRRLLKNGECPKLQVAEKDGQYFTLNNTRLQVFRWLESAGRCKRVKVDRVPLRVIPEGIRKLMTVGGMKDGLDEGEWLRKLGLARQHYRLKLGQYPYCMAISILIFTLTLSICGIWSIPATIPVSIRYS